MVIITTTNSSNKKENCDIKYDEEDYESFPPGNNNNNSKNNNNKEENFMAPADFETAISATGYGRFNIILFMLVIPASGGSVFETSVVSYILPSAECDLSLSLVDKGVLNAITYCGMILSAVVWGYLADTKGRKKILVFGFLADVFCVLGSAMSQNVWQLMLFKFLGGLIMGGPFAVLMSFLSEFHSNHYRPRIMMLVGITFSVSALVLPVMAMLILPQKWDFYILDMHFTAWKVFVAVSAIPSLISGIFFNFFPESPRFLMSQGRNKEAMEAFKTVYSMNTGKPRDTYPIKELVDELEDSKHEDNLSVATIESVLKETSCKSMEHKINISRSTEDHAAEHHSKHHSSFKDLFSKTYLKISILVYLLNFCILMGQNTIRLWLPQLFASTIEYENLHPGPDTNLCSILEYSVNKTQTQITSPKDSCVVIITPDIYTNNLIVAATGFFANIIASYLIDYVGSKRIQITGLFCAGSCAVGLYWSSSSVSTLIISTIYTCMGSIASTATIGAAVSLFPTSLRTMVVSLSLMFGRIGSITGNVLFPVFMSMGCIPPIVMVAAIMYTGSMLGIFLPSPNKTNK